MSNPGLITLIRKKIENGKLLKVEDNIGEAIHLHYGDFRLDFTVNEYNDICDRIVAFADSLNTVPGFRKELFSPEFLVLLCDRLEAVEKITVDSVELSSLKCYVQNRVWGKSVSVSKTGHMNGNSSYSDGFLAKKNEIICTENNLIDKAIAKTNGEELGNSAPIVLFNDSNLIQYGTNLLPELIKNGADSVEAVRIYSKHKDFNRNKWFYLKPCICENMKQVLRTRMVSLIRMLGLYRPARFVWRMIHRGT